MYTIAKAKEAIKKGVKGYLLKDGTDRYVLREENRLPFYLEGAPGIGKTEIVQQIARELGLGYVSFSLVHHTRNSLLGLPVIKDLESGAKYTCYTMSEILAKVLEQVEQGKKEGILLLDEFPCMSETIQPTMLSFLQTKNIGSYTLPEGWVIVLCGNPPAYNKTAKTFDAAIMDRIRKLEVAFQPDVFLEYGEKIELHDAVLEYLRAHPKHVYRCVQEKGKMELVTCRGWENVSHMLKTYEILGQDVDGEAVRQYLKSEEIAESFYQFYVQYNTGMNRKMVEDVLSGTRVVKHAKTCALMDYNAKRSLLDYMMGLLKKQYSDLYIRDECLAEGNRLLQELEQALPKLFDAEMTNSLFGLSIDEMLDIIKENPEITLETGERREVIRCLKEFEADWGGDDLVWDEELTTEKQIYEKFYGKLKHWCDVEGGMVANQAQEAAKKLDNMLKFVEKIDSGNTLTEMIFGQINREPSFLRALSLHPGEVYLRLCEARYGLSAS